MKTKSINEIYKEIKNMKKQKYSNKYITGDQFEKWLKSKKENSIKKEK